MYVFDYDFTSLLAGLASLSAPMFYADIYQSHLLHMCIFGFKRRGSSLPLHDHPDMYGFVKVIRGEITVSSYSDIGFQEQNDLKQGPISESVRTVRFVF